MSLRLRQPEAGRRPGMCVKALLYLDARGGLALWARISESARRERLARAQLRAATGPASGATGNAGPIVTETAAVLPIAGLVDPNSLT